jgi:hypothetical protein
MKEDIIQKFILSGYSSFPCGSARFKKPESNKKNSVRALIKKEVSSLQK